MFLLLDDIQTGFPSSNRVPDWEEPHPQVGLFCKLLPDRRPQAAPCDATKVSGVVPSQDLPTFSALSHAPSWPHLLMWAWLAWVANGDQCCLGRGGSFRSTNEKLFELCSGARIILEFETVQKSYLGVLWDNLGEVFKIRRVLESDCRSQAY